MRSKTPTLSFLIVIVFIALIQVACEVPRQRSTPTPEPGTVAVCTTINEETPTSQSYELPAEPYVPGELLITGDPVDIARVLAEIPEFEEIRTRVACGTVIIDVESVQLEATAQLSQLTTGLQTRLYPVPDNLTVWEAIEKIYVAVWELVEANPADPPIVFSDPNYILGYDVDGDPSNGHSGIGGTAVGGLAALPPAQPSAQEAAFWNQWAFGEGGIQISDGAGGRNPDLPTGEGTTIVLFDTSPLPAGAHSLNWVTPALELEVLAPVPVPANAPPPGGDETVRQHGVYAAGLAHAVAPDSEKVLVRVLNDTAQGDLFSLLKGIATYTNVRLAEANAENLVYNFSLGVNPFIREVGPPEEALNHIRDLIAGEVPEYAALLDDGSLELGMVPIPTLRKMFIDLNALGITSVAAAGNDSDNSTTVYTQRPAAYPEVIAVAATDFSGEPACYSNVGQLAAPGGAGAIQRGTCTPQEVTNYCREVEDVNSPACNFALISLVTETKNGTPNGYAYWIGTSFSTPMVSGLSALLLASSPASLLPGQVFSLVNSGATAGSCSSLPIPAPGTTNRLGVGIISVPTALDNLNAGTCP